MLILIYQNVFIIDFLIIICICISYDVILAPFIYTSRHCFFSRFIYNFGFGKASCVQHTFYTFDIFLEAYMYVFYGFFIKF